MNIPAADLAPPTHEQLHRLRRALLGPDPAAAEQPIAALSRLLDAVDNEPAAHLLCTESIDDPNAWSSVTDTLRAMLAGVEDALRGAPCPDAEVADPWATLRAAGFGKGEAA